MRIVVVGRGVIGSLYGYLWSQAGFSVAHFVKPNRLEAARLALTFDVLDQGRPIIRAQYQPQVSDEASILATADWVVVSLRHRDSLNAVRTLVPNAPNARFLCFGNQWHGLKPFSELLPPDRLCFGMPRAGGAIAASGLRGALYRDVVLGTPANEAVKEDLSRLFTACGRRLVWIDDMQSWYRTHLATTCAWICDGTKAKGFLPFSRSLRAICEALAVGRECLVIAKAYGSNTSVCDDVKPFQAPALIATVMTWLALRTEMTQRISAGHGDYAPDEMTAIYEDILTAGMEFNVKTPLLQAFKPHFLAMNQALAEGF